MADRERVISGLKHCLGNDCSGDGWNRCEYSGHGCVDALLEDALALLKAQEPNLIPGAGLTDAELMEKVRKAPITQKPAADAIPVEWIKNRLEAMLRGPASAESCFAVLLLLADWMKEQEGRT